MVSEFEQTVRIFYRFMDLRTLPKWLSEPHKKAFIVPLIFKFGCPDCIRDVSG